MYELSGYLFGEFLSVVAGVGLGAAIVGFAWGASNRRFDWLAGERQRKLDEEREQAETELINQAIERGRVRV